MNDGKTWFKSKTLWANFIVIVTGVSTILTGETDLGTTIPALVLAAINILLRFMTKGPVIGGG